MQLKVKSGGGDSSTTAPTPSGHGFTASSTRTVNGPEPAGHGMVRARISSRRVRRTRTCRTTAATSTSSQSTRCRVITMALNPRKTISTLGFGHRIRREVIFGGCCQTLQKLLDVGFAQCQPAAAVRTTTCHTPWRFPFGGVWGSLSTSWGGAYPDTKWAVKMHLRTIRGGA